MGKFWAGEIERERERMITKEERERKKDGMNKMFSSSSQRDACIMSTDDSVHLLSLH